MLSSREITTIKAEIQWLEEERKNCTDSGIQRLIDAWIEGQRMKLRSESVSRQLMSSR
jgi:hypothetical protein